MAYRKVESQTLLDFLLQSVRQMFHTLRPAPFHEKDLVENEAAYLQQAEMKPEVLPVVKNS